MVLVEFVFAVAVFVLIAFVFLSLLILLSHICCCCCCSSSSPYLSSSFLVFVIVLVLPVVVFVDGVHCGCHFCVVFWLYFVNCCLWLFFLVGVVCWWFNFLWFVVLVVC